MLVQSEYPAGNHNHRIMPFLIFYSDFPIFVGDLGSEVNDFMLLVSLSKDE